MKKRKREIKEQKNFPAQSFILDHAQTEAFFYLIFKSIGVRAGGRGGLQPPQILGNSDFLGSKRKFGHSQLLKKFHVFFISILKR